MGGAGGGIRTHEPLRDSRLRAAPLTWLGNPRAWQFHACCGLSTGVVAWQNNRIRRHIKMLYFVSLRQASSVVGSLLADSGKSFKHFNRVENECT